MKIVVVSDNHGDREIIQKIVDHYEGKVDGIFHCGDSEFKQGDPLISKLHLVAGNMDFEPFADHDLTTIDGHTILTTHGHHQNVNSGLLTLKLYGRSLGVDIVLFGHTHQLGAEMEDGMLFVNPGSISYPRGQYAPIGGTFAVIDGKQDTYEVQYYDRQLSSIDQLKFHFSS